jgi:hypothetical protein
LRNTPQRILRRILQSVADQAESSCKKKLEEEIVLPDTPQEPSDTSPRPEDGPQPTDQNPNYVEVEVGDGQVDDQ